MSEYAIKTKNN